MKGSQMPRPARKIRFAQKSQAHTQNDLPAWREPSTTSIQNASFSRDFENNYKKKQKQRQELRVLRLRAQVNVELTMQKVIDAIRDDLASTAVNGGDLLRLTNAHFGDSSAVFAIRDAVRDELRRGADAELSRCVDAVMTQQAMLLRFVGRVLERSSALRKSDADSADTRLDCKDHFATGVAVANGNDHRTARHHFELALRTANEALAQAEPDGEAYALALANRAAVLAKLSLPELATRDCNEALALSALPEATRIKVNDRLRLLAADASVPPTPTMPTSFQNAHVAAARDERRGRHVVVVGAALPRGATVSCEQLDGGQFALDHKHLSRYCCRCLRPLIAVYPCAGCTLARYCSPQCRAAQPHRLCDKFAALGAVLPPRALLAVNVLRAARPVPQLLSHWRRLDADIVAFHAIFLSAVALMLSVSPVALLDIALAAETNLHSLVDHPTSLSRQIIGVALGGGDGLASTFNHSCRPNCTVTWRGSTMIVSTLRAVDIGEELTLSYGPHVVAHPNIAARRAHLQSCYFFDCRCEACGPDNDAVADDAETSRIAALLAQMEREERELPTMPADKALLVHEARAQRVLPALFGGDSLQVARAVAAWAHALARVGDWPRACQTAAAALASLRAFGVAGDPELSEMQALLAHSPAPKSAATKPS
jgi:hypothetical protein